MQLHDVYLSVYFNKPSVDITNKKMKELCECFIGARINSNGIIVHARHYRYKGIMKLVLRCFISDDSTFGLMSINLRFYDPSIKIIKSDITKVVAKKISPKVKISTMNM